MFTKMLTLDTIILIAFKLTIFFLLAIQLYQIGKQYLVPLLRKQMAAAGEFFEALQNKLDLLRTTKKRIETSIEQQTETLQDLEHEIKVWHQALQSKQAKLDQEQQEIFKNLIEKREKQFAYLQARKNEKQLIPKAIDEARQKLRDRYAGAKGKEILASVISQLPRSKTP